MYGRPVGARSPSGRRTSSPSVARMRGGLAPLECWSQTVPSGRTPAGPRSGPPGCTTRGAPPRAGFVGIQAMAGFMLLPKEQRRGVRPPSSTTPGPAEARLQVDPRVGREIPHRGRLLASALVHDREAVVAGDGRPSRGREAPALGRAVRRAAVRPCADPLPGSRDARGLRARNATARGARRRERDREGRRPR